MVNKVYDIWKISSDLLRLKIEKKNRISAPSRSSPDATRNIQV